MSLRLKDILENIDLTKPLTHTEIIEIIEAVYKTKYSIKRYYSASFRIALVIAVLLLVPDDPEPLIRTLML